MRILYAIAMSLMLGTTVRAETLTMPEDGAVELLHRFLDSDPPDFDELARESRKARDASEFDRAAVIKSEKERLRQEFMAMKGVDELVLRVGDRLGEYDANAGGFPLATFQPDIFLRFARTRLTFDNYAEFSTWKLPVAEAQAVLPRLGYGRSVVLELRARPFATGHGGGREIRSQVRSIRILTEEGALLAELASAQPERPIIPPGAAVSTTIPNEKLDLLGLKIGSGRKAFAEWAKATGFDAESVEETWTSLSFTANSKGVKHSSYYAPGKLRFSPLLIAGTNFDCGTEVEAERLCGEAVFSGEEDISQQRIRALRMVQNITGVTTEQVIAKLTEKYGSYSDSFDATAGAGIALEGNHQRTRHYVWGGSFPRDRKQTGGESFTDIDENWQIEAVVFQPEVNRTVLLIQLIGLPETGASPASEVRL